MSGYRGFQAPKLMFSLSWYWGFEGLGPGSLSAYWGFGTTMKEPGVAETTMDDHRSHLTRRAEAQVALYYAIGCEFKLLITLFLNSRSLDYSTLPKHDHGSCIWRDTAPKYPGPRTRALLPHPGSTSLMIPTAVTTFRWTTLQQKPVQKEIFKIRIPAHRDKCEFDAISQE